MPPLVNEFTWSFSRSRLFDQCRRRYYYCYYGSWNGWDVQGPPEARLLYRLKQIMTLPMWAGKVVHRTIELAIKRLQRHHPMDLKTMQAVARKMLNEEWLESETRLWMRHPKKHVNLFDHYYGREVTADQRAALRDTVFDSLQAWFDLGLATQLAAVRPEDWLTVEELKSFDCGGIKVWVVMDCAFRREGGVAIYDWKTGAPSEEESVSDQLIVYAMYAMQEWQAALDGIQASLVHLPAQTILSHTILPEQLIDFRERLYQSAQAMLGCLADPARNAASEADFPRTTHEFSCMECEYREVCLAE